MAEPSADRDDLSLSERRCPVRTCPGGGARGARRFDVSTKRGATARRDGSIAGAGVRGGVARTAGIGETTAAYSMKGGWARQSAPRGVEETTELR